MTEHKHEFLSIYRALEHDLKKEFFIPFLENANVFQLATGFFTLSGFSELIEVIIPIIKKRGRIKILTSPLLNKEDVEMIKTINLPDNYIERIIIEEISSYKEGVENLEIKLLAALLKEEIIELKIVYSTKGILHDKTGYVIKNDGEEIAYNGSANLTFSGIFSNIESISVYTEDKNKDAIKNTIDYLEKLWEGQFSSVKVLLLSEAIKNKLLMFNDENESIDSLIKKIEEKSKSILDRNNAIAQSTENKVGLREYQGIAVKEFKENEYIHFFEMATGTGKTYTALFALQELQKKLNNRLFTIVLLPWIDLMFQWTESAENADIPGKKFRLGGGAHSGSGRSVFDKALQSFISGENVTIFAVTNSYQIYSKSFFKNYWNHIKDNLFIIVDEAHNITEALYNSLPNAKYRLGLSATPNRGEGIETENILNYFKGKKYLEAYKYGLKEAIEHNFLSKYYYHPIFVHLSDEEYKRYLEESRIIAIYIDYENEEEKNILDRALQRRALIVKKAENKIVRLSEMLKSENYKFDSSVIYCGPGKITEEQKMVDYITNIVHNMGKYDVRKFVAETENREQVLKDFANGYYNTLVAIKCFDEGIDVPSLNRLYILSSDNNYRQTVQRRGRALRKSKETGKKYAEIFDFIVLPPVGTPYSQVKPLIKNEMSRLIEYSSLSENHDKQLKDINKILKQAELELEEVTYND